MSTEHITQPGSTEALVSPRLDHPELGGQPAGGNRTAGKRSAVVIVASNSAASGRASDTTGPRLVEWLRARGFSTPNPVVVPDGKPVSEALIVALHQDPAVIITSGGTGLTPDDQTPEQTAPLLDRTLPGIMHALWSYGSATTPHAVLSRGLAGVHGRTFIVNLPGSQGGVADGIAVLDPILDHLLKQIADIRDHTRRTVTGAHTVNEPGETAAAPAIVHSRGITEGQLDIAELEGFLRDLGHGAVASFRGVVRTSDSGRDDVASLEYTAHPDAERIMEQVAREVVAAFPGVKAVCQHRVGVLFPGDTAIYVGVSSPHRAAAFACCGELVNQIKARVPIWKQQTYHGGEHDWVGLQ